MSVICLLTYFIYVFCVQLFTIYFTDKHNFHLFLEVPLDRFTNLYIYISLLFWFYNVSIIYMQ